MDRPSVLARGVTGEAGDALGEGAPSVLLVGAERLALDHAHRAVNVGRRRPARRSLASHGRQVRGDVIVEVGARLGDEIPQRRPAFAAGFVSEPLDEHVVVAIPHGVR